MKYEVHILNVGDADAIVVKYTYDDVNWALLWGLTPWKKNGKKTESST